MPLLSVNVDHVCTVRQARKGAEPDPVLAAEQAELGGADGITVHLREDRRHIQDEDVRRLRRAVATRLHLEMAATREMIQFAAAVKPVTAMLVPERRQELTTEGGLDAAAQVPWLTEAIKMLGDAGIPVSLFIDAEARQVDAAKQVGASICELHTGPWAHAVQEQRGELAGKRSDAELEKLRTAGRLVLAAGLQLNAGHALNTHNVGPVARLPGLHELHIGHSIVSRALFVGLKEAVREMKAAIFS
ncbi:MAG: pyridoxine 5'-phosphate synthase [Planctomycetes bacterium]|nr:pyridoxine 5'-phosphate synthase [Planctomycetota bacterium]